MRTRLEFEVVDGRRINCARCEVRISDALGGIPGVEKVEASAETQRVSVTVDSRQVSSQQLRAALVELGYSPA